MKGNKGKCGLKRTNNLALIFSNVKLLNNSCNVLEADINNYALKFHIIAHSSQFLVQRTLCILQLHQKSLKKRFTTESNELSLEC